MGINGDTGLSGPASITNIEIKNGSWTQKHAELNGLCLKIVNFLENNPNIATKVEITKQSINSYI